jgi:hypothetical protein
VYYFCPIRDDLRIFYGDRRKGGRGRRRRRGKGEGRGEGEEEKNKKTAFHSSVKMSYKAETLTNNLSLFFLICVNGMLSCGLAFCSSELPVRTYKKGIKLY